MTAWREKLIGGGRRVGTDGENDDGDGDGVGSRQICASTAVGTIAAGRLNGPAVFPDKARQYRAQ